jgi:filamentous hemagglutinin family protein
LEKLEKSSAIAPRLLYFGVEFGQLLSLDRLSHPMPHPHHSLAAFSLVALAVAGLPLSALAQVAGDGTLGTLVNGAPTAPCTGACLITNGTTRGSNLFHSFQQFSLPNGDYAGFVTTPAIQNVIVRVTGQGNGFASNINGVIETATPVNFFLLNPNGIIFGSNARLLIGGSFLATTAERMLFQDGTILSTRDPAPLLTISVPTGLQMGQAPGNIEMKGSQLLAGQNSLFGDFALVGGDVTLNNSTILAQGRRVELGGVGENGAVELRQNADRLSLNLLAEASRRDVSLTNGSRVNVVASNGRGEIVAAGRSIILTGSAIFAGIIPGIDNAATNQAGNITINATVNLQLTQNSFIANGVGSNAIGKGGNIRINAADIQVRGGSSIGANTYGDGNTGNVQVTANSIGLDGGRIGSQVELTGSGRGGDVTVETSSLTVTNGAAVSASTFGNGDGGNVRVKANTIALSGIASGIGSEVFGTGSGGDVSVETGSLTVTNSAVVSASTFGNGNGGNVRVKANTIALDDIVSGIGSEVKLTGSGRGGDVTIEADSLSVTNGAAVSASTFGNGDGGNVRVTANTVALDGTTPNGQLSSVIASGVGFTGRGRGGDVTVETGSLTITNGATVSASTLSNGNAGNVRVTANTIALDGTTPDELFTSRIASEVWLGAIGTGGDVTVQTDSLTITNGALISSSTGGNGNGGDVRVIANSIVLDGTVSNGQFSSGVGSQVGFTATGNGGDVTVETGSLTVTNGAAVSASTFGNGDGGNVRVIANSIVLDGTASNKNSSGINSGVASTGSGRGGDITVQTDSLTVTDGASVSSSALGNGGAGNLDITARTIYLEGGGIVASAVSGNGANITLSVSELLLLRRSSQISTSAGLAGAGGDGGNITIAAPRGFIVGVRNENSDITANAFTGSGGRVNITAQGIYGLQFRPQLTAFSDITASSTFGISGIVTLDTPDIDPSRGLQELPLDLADPSRQVLQTCSRGAGSRELGSFVVTGRGGLPQNPTDLLPGSLPVKPLATLDESTSSVLSQQTSAAELNSTVPEPIIEAQKIVKTADGRIFLVAESSSSTGLGSSIPEVTPPFRTRKRKT